MIVRKRFSNSVDHIFDCTQSAIQLELLRVDQNLPEITQESDHTYGSACARDQGWPPDRWLLCSGTAHPPRGPLTTPQKSLNP